MRTNVRDTSILAFFGEVKPTLTQRQEQVLAVFYENPHTDWTNMEIANELGFSINRVTPRTHELRKLGVLKESRRRFCKVTGRRVWAWKIA